MKTHVKEYLDCNCPDCGDEMECRSYTDDQNDKLAWEYYECEKCERGRNAS